jgi:hypothetical protein
MDAIVKDHEKDLVEFEKETKNGSDPDVKSFAEKTVTQCGSIWQWRKRSMPS